MINRDQTSGIFRIPEGLCNSLEINRLKDKTSNFKRKPLVVSEEIYYRQGLEAKLRLSYPSIRKLSKIGLIRPEKSEQFQYNEQFKEPVSNLSLAQTISWMFKKPIESILVSEDKFVDESFLNKKPYERVDILFNAYLGCRWFELFRRRQLKIAENVKIPKIKFNQKISKKQLEDLLLITDFKPSGTITRLCEKGFIVPYNGNGFKSKSMYNFIDNKALAKLISLIHEIDLDEIFVKDKDEIINELAESLAYRKLLNYMSDKGINKHKEYSISEASSITCIRYTILYYAVQRGAIKNTEFKRKDTKIKGIDLAIYVLKNTNKLVFKKEDICDMFGVKNLNIKDLDMHVSKRDTYSRHHYVFPIYDMIAEKARNEICRL